jgi:hypothetical protein
MRFSENELKSRWKSEDGDESIREFKEMTFIFILSSTWSTWSTLMLLDEVRLSFWALLNPFESQRLNQSNKAAWIGLKAGRCIEYKNSQNVVLEVNSVNKIELLLHLNKPTKLFHWKMSIFFHKDVQFTLHIQLQIWSKQH